MVGWPELSVPCLRPWPFKVIHVTFMARSQRPLRSAESTQWSGVRSPVNWMSVPRGDAPETVWMDPATKPGVVLGWGLRLRPSHGCAFGIPSVRGGGGGQAG